MTPEEVIGAASERTGLTAIGDPAVLEGLERLLYAYENEARFTERGWEMAHEELVRNMALRMKVVGWLSDHPELLQRPIEKPLFVFGLPRTGTTLVINLLHSDPARRSFLRWEAYEPVPPPRPNELHAGPRYDAMQAQSDMAREHVPHITAIHYEDADSPTECQFLMTPSFCAQVYEAQADVPSYRHWLLHEADYGPAFDFHKRMLQLLQAHTGGRWTLKNPWHPLFLDTLTAVYPDAQLVMTHRDPADVLGSTCSLIKNVRAMFSDEVDLKGIGESFADTFELMIARADAFKEKHGDNAILDVQYADVMRDPIGEVGRINAHFDEPMSAEARAAMEKYMADNPKGKHGRHEYALEEYGLTREGVHERFAGYIERYAIAVRH